MARHRMDRINSQLQREISVILSQQVRDEELHGVIVTSVECSKDLKYARVYFTILRKEHLDHILELLEKASGFIRSTLGRTLSYRTVPQLTFKFDDSEVLAREMDEVLNRIVAELPEETEEDRNDERDDAYRE